jgi:hypothetical protein
MNQQFCFRYFLLIAFIAFTGFASENSLSETDELHGTWVRIADKLRIEISKQQQGDQLESYIVAEGREKFPCEVSHLPIYKNIHKVGRSLWRCEFLVVTLGSCHTEYEEGIIQVKDDVMTITCPGFDKKIYTKVKPRYEGN